jgi:4'-phosphopantetheinyl transferase EntD
VKLGILRARMGDCSMLHSVPDFPLVDTRRLPHGTLSAIALPAPASDADLPSVLASAREALHPDEWTLSETLAPPRRVAFVGGRLALRTALRDAQPTLANAPILRTPRRAPSMPPGALGSVSHKRRLAVALVSAPTDAVHTLGVDVEERPDADDLTRPDLAPKILTPLERHELAPLAASDPLGYRVAVRLRFALKEAVYKAIDPHVQRYVRFQEVEVFPGAAGAVAVRLALPEFAGRHITVQAYWTELHGHLVATAAGSTVTP